MATIIKPDGTVTHIYPTAKNGKFKLDHLQGIVGGYIAIVYLDDTRVMVVNESGHLEGLDPNEVASEMANEGHDGFTPPYSLVGTAVYCTRAEVGA